MDSIQIENALAKTQNIEAILSSLDGIKRAEAPPFLYGKIISRPNSPKHDIFDKFTYLLSRPAVVISFFFIFLLLDGLVFRSFLKNSPEKSENPIEEIFTSDYLDEMMLYDTSVNEYAFIE